MREGLDEPVSVVWFYHAPSRRLTPYRLSWQGREYRLGKVDFWHKTWQGKTLIHHFSLADTDGQAYFKLAFNTDTLHWTIEEYMPAGEAVVTYRRYEA
jgi:hypothetical protein